MFTPTGLDVWDVVAGLLHDPDLEDGQAEPGADLMASGTGQLPVGIVPLRCSDLTHRPDRGAPQQLGMASSESR